MPKTNTDEQIIADAIQSIKEVENKIPAVLIIHNLRDWRVAWMSERGLKLLGIGLEEITKLTQQEYYSNYFNEEDAKDYVPKIFELLEKNDADNICTFFHQVRFKLNEPWCWHFASSKILAYACDGKPLLTITTAFPIQDMQNITKKAERILEENNFLRKNYDRFSKLSNRELEVLHHWATSKTSAETGNLMNISPLTVETHRKNIKTKLNASSFFDITQYARSFDLI